MELSMFMYKLGGDNYRSSVFVDKDWVFYFGHNKSDDQKIYKLRS